MCGCGELMHKHFIFYVGSNNIKYLKIIHRKVQGI